MRSSLTPAELVRIESHAFNAAWISPEEHRPYLGRLDAFAKAWGVTA